MNQSPDDEVHEDASPKGGSAEDVDLRAAARAFQRARTSGEATTSRSGSTDKRPKKRRATRSGDPQLVGSAVEEFLATQGWDENAALAGLADRWAEIVGPEVAEHVQIESWAEGELVLRADSTAWATQVRLLSATLLEQVREAVGSGIVETVQVNGPSAPSWRAGPRVVKGRGPRDTYG